MSSKAGKILPILELGNPILRQKAAPVSDISDRKIQSLIDDMIVTSIEAPGVGLAAPQVGQSIRLFVVTAGENPDDPQDLFNTPQAIINPEIVKFSSDTHEDWEGCLSIPGIRGKVNRAVTLKVKYFDRNGKPVEVEVHDFIARIFQHEYDHLDGIVFLDRMRSMATLMTEAEYQRASESKKKKKK